MRTCIVHFHARLLSCTVGSIPPRVTLAETEVTVSVTAALVGAHHLMKKLAGLTVPPIKGATAAARVAVTNVDAAVRIMW